MSMILYLTTFCSIPEPRIMIADSSSRLQRTNGTGGSLATALRDRGPCVIPVQPNRSLPIRPAPPTPTRSAASIVTLRKTRSPILKLSKSIGLDVVELQSSSGSLTNELNEFPFGQQDGNGDGMMLTNELIDRSDYILPDMSNVVQVTNWPEDRPIFIPFLSLRKESVSECAILLTNMRFFSSLYENKKNAN